MPVASWKKKGKKTIENYNKNIKKILSGMLYPILLCLLFQNHLLLALVIAIYKTIEVLFSVVI